LKERITEYTKLEKERGKNTRQQGAKEKTKSS
jgi:hypothetical protein